MNQIRKLVVLFLTSCFVLTLTASVVFAVGVEPARTELTIDPGSSASAMIRVINSEIVPVKVKSKITIYAKNDEHGFPVEEELAVDHPMNIRDWIDFPDEVLEIGPNSEEQIIFTVNVPANARSGGRYASIVYFLADDDDNFSELNVEAVPGLILVKVSGEEIHRYVTQDFWLEFKKLLSDQGPILKINLENQGNIHESPKGNITIYEAETGELLKQISSYRDPVSGELVTTDEIPLNLDGGNVLPGSSRIFTAKWSENIKPGKFTAKLLLEQEDNQPVIIETTEFEIKEDLKLNNFTVSQLEDSTDFKIVLTNNGNVYEKLVGEIEVLDESGDSVATLGIPTDVGYIAPGSTATITVSWLEKQAPKGRYIAKLTAACGFSNTPIKEEIKFALSCGDFESTSLGIGGILAILLTVFGFAVLVKRGK